MEISTKDPLLEFPPNLQETLRKKYNLDNGRMLQSVEILEDWIKKQEHIVNKNYSRRYLEVSIITCKGSVEKAKKQIDKLCTLRTLAPQFFVCRDIKNIYERLNDLATFIVLPKMTKENQRVFVLKVYDKEFTSSHFMDYFRLTFVIAEYLKAHDYTDGFVIIDDYRDVNLLDLLTKTNLVELQQYVTILTEGFGAKLKGIHIITQSKVVDLFVKTMKTVVSPKIAGRINVLPEIEDVYQYVDKEILPADYGGGDKRTLKDIRAKWMDLVCSEEHENYLEVMKASGTDESLRQADKFNEKYMGLPGSFRTLTVD